MLSRIRRLVQQLKDLLNVPVSVHAESRRLGEASHVDHRDLQRALKDQTRRIEDLRARHAAQHAALEKDIHSIHGEVHDRLLQYHLQLARLTTLIEGKSEGAPVYSTTIPLTMAAAPPSPVPAAS